jgi:hypothetical protein
VSEGPLRKSDEILVGRLESRVRQALTFVHDLQVSVATDEPLEALDAPADKVIQDSATPSGYQPALGSDPPRAHEGPKLTAFCGPQLISPDPNGTRNLPELPCKSTRSLGSYGIRSLGARDA